mmetsp:Transcript_15143/g.40623  ORF Transcript_15143/g.40623 Transcript_15143/m.40623 type:complete len:505 (-) Transcript_15143:307-1821(-)
MKKVVAGSSRSFGAAGRGVGHLAQTPYRYEFEFLLERVTRVKPGAKEALLVIERRNKLEATPLLPVAQREVRFGPEHKIRIEVTLFKKGGADSKQMVSNSGVRSPPLNAAAAGFEEKMTKIALRIEKPGGTTLGKLHFNLAEYAKMPSGTVRTELELNNGSVVYLRIASRYMATEKKPNLITAMKNKASSSVASSRFSRGTGGLGKAESSIANDDFLDDLDDLDDLIGDDDNNAGEAGSSDDFQDLKDEGENSFVATMPKETAKDKATNDKATKDRLTKDKATAAQTDGGARRGVADLSDDGLNDFDDDLDDLETSAPQAIHTTAPVAAASAKKGDPKALQKEYDELVKQLEVARKQRQVAEKDLSASNQKLAEAQRRAREAKRELDDLDAEAQGVLRDGAGAQESEDAQLRAAIRAERMRVADLSETNERLQETLELKREREQLSGAQHMSARRMRAEMEELRLQVLREPELDEVREELREVKARLIDIRLQKDDAQQQLLSW